MTTALQAISSIPAASNLILSVDPMTLPVKKNQDTLLKLQTMLFTLRTEGITLKNAYLLDFLKSISSHFPGGWNTHGQQDESEFYQKLIQAIESDLLPADKRATFHGIMNIRQDVINPSGTTATDEDVAVRIQGTLVNVNSVQTGLDEYFKTPSAGVLAPHYRIAADPSVLSIYVNRFSGTPSVKDAAKQIAIPMTLAINNYRSAALATSMPLSPQYELRFVAVHHGDTPGSGHYYGYKRDGSRWIKFDDSNVHVFDGNVTEITSHGQDTAFMLHYVNVNQKADLLRENPVPGNVRTLIDGQLAQHATVISAPPSTTPPSTPPTTTPPKKTPWYKPKNDAPKLTSGLLSLLPVVVVVALLN